MKWVDLADTVLRTFQGLLRSVTDAMKDTTRGILNTNFESAFQRECQLLNCPSVRLEFPGRQAATLRHKSVGANYRLGEVLSEGEQKVIALADFLAEVSMRPSTAPVILDDPITSLDARRVDEVADRIVNLELRAATPSSSPTTCTSRRRSSPPSSSPRTEVTAASMRFSLKTARWAWCPRGTPQDGRGSRSPAGSIRRFRTRGRRPAPCDPISSPLRTGTCAVGSRRSSRTTCSRDG